MTATTLYSVSFQWRPGEYDAEFHRLNAIIGGVARAMPDFAGVDSWRSPDGTRAGTPATAWSWRRCCASTATDG
jgi:hypothetical protein